MNVPSGIPKTSSISRDEDLKETTIVFGGGLAGLSAAYHLTNSGLKTIVFEADSTVGGLSKTIVSGNFRFDIGGHRFFTKNKRINDMIINLMGDELISVARKSKIYMRGRFFDYPLKPFNAIFGLGFGTVIRILSDYGAQRLKNLSGNGTAVSLEDWVVGNFGRTMFNIYFKEYSEKVWGLDCKRISQKWVEKRIEGLSLGKALKNAFFKFSGKGIPTLANSFYYPRLGIGRISDRLEEEISSTNNVQTNTGIVRIHHEGFAIKEVEVKNKDHSYKIRGSNYISTIPLNTVVKMLSPAPPPDVLDAASKLGYRDLALVAVALRKPHVTDQTWIYIPEKKIPFGRIHEPKCWSKDMAPHDKTLLVIEFFCNRGDAIWNSSDKDLSETALNGLVGLGFINRSELISTSVLRIPRAYPLFEVGYDQHCDVIYDYFDKFTNLHLAGRAGLFKYQNMDHAMASGIEAAEKIIVMGKKH